MKEKKLRKKLIDSKIMKLRVSLDFIEENLPKEYEDFDNKIIKNAIYKETEYAIELVMDFFSIINSDLRLGMPNEDADIIENFEKNQIFSKDLLKTAKEMKKFRNILVHKYGDINDEEAYENIKEGLSDFEKIIKEAEDFLIAHR